jgi:RNA polymerase sigma factor (sigma-70 family)
VLLFHFCRVQLPAVALSDEVLERHLDRTFALHNRKNETPVPWRQYLDNLYPLDWFVACACLEGDGAAWDYLFAAKASRSDCLLVDALRARAVRLYPGDEERQESAVTEFWSQLLAADSDHTLPVLARYDGQRPLVPWLIRVFQNQHVSQLRHRAGFQPLPDDDLTQPVPAPANEAQAHWHEAFRDAARAALDELSDSELLILGLRLRYRLSQRDAAQVLGLHEGTISRQTTQLRDRCLDRISQTLIKQGWTGDDLSGFVLAEMGSVLLDEPRLSGDHLAALLAARGKKAPPLT